MMIAAAGLVLGHQGGAVVRILAQGLGPGLGTVAAAVLQGTATPVHTAVPRRAIASRDETDQRTGKAALTRPWSMNRMTGRRVAAGVLHRTELTFYLLIFLSLCFKILRFIFWIINVSSVIIVCYCKGFKSIWKFTLEPVVELAF